jgi:hypothetical protein
MNAFRLVALILALALTPAAHAAESYDSCTGYVSSLPATISTQGTWCLNKDLSTGLSYVDAINVAANNVTIDCNGFKLGGLSAGAGTLSNGIGATDRFNVTVRNCNIRGFAYGVFLLGTAPRTTGGHIVEDNRFEANTYIGISVDGDGSVVRRNLVVDTGLTPSFTDPQGIRAYWGTDVLDNTIVGVTALAGSNDSVYGIYSFGSPGNSVSGNRVRGLVADGTGTTRGIALVFSQPAAAVGNVIAGSSGGTGEIGLFCTAAAGAGAKDNVIMKFATGIDGCVDAGGNAVVP